jgi:hypothetical protein
MLPGPARSSATFKLCNESLGINFAGLDELPPNYLRERKLAQDRIRSGDCGPGIVHLGGSSKFAGGHFFDIMDRHFRALPADVRKWGICAV